MEQNYSQGNTENMRQVMGFKPPDHATLKKKTVFDHHSFLQPKYLQTFSELFRNAHSLAMYVDTQIMMAGHSSILTTRLLSCLLVRVIRNVGTKATGVFIASRKLLRKHRDRFY
jgi:hypothetical protein